ncbi:lamin tail domain-containing protein, partial [Candidatus Methanarcanum hacksteinii]|uniref:lamin tail domain-containing protein n=1 Tax=Candidatus Methanarcanum hacksteinii TaxID=2911857 RepID=UPI0037DD0391
MDAHRKLMACIAVFAMLACMVPAVTDVETTDAYGDADSILLYEVCSVDDKGVTLKNYSNSTIDLKGYYVSDKEGYFTFTKSLKLGAGQTITVALKDTDTKFTSRGTVYVIDDNDVGIVKTKSFDPAKDGDDIYLYNPSDVIVDAMCYGSKTITDSSVWTGGSVGKTNRFLQREGTFDTDSA